jgi:trans-aconitate methyltransferase
VGYYDDEHNVRQYIQMAEGYDGQLLIDRLITYIPEGSTVLELGMGPGKDLLLLSQSFQAVGSDASKVFIDIFRKDHPDSDVFQMDALAMDTQRRFNTIYSNKVLHHLLPHDLQTSLKRQAPLLNPRGVLLHSFWYGSGQDHMHGLHHVYYTEETLCDIIPETYEVIEIERYAEIEENDSLYIVLRSQ